MPEDGYRLLGLTGDGRGLFRLPLPDRGHAAAALAQRPEAGAFARRPGTFALVIDCAAGREVARGTGRSRWTGRCSSPPRTRSPKATDGCYRRIGEVPTGGTGPHEVKLMPDGLKLAVANGGIETHPTSGRAELNLATMRSNLAYVDVATGAVVDVLELPPELRLNSIRHLATGRDGTLAAGLQWQGSELEHPPLLAVHRPGARGLETLAAEPAMQRRARNYAGSVAVSDDGRWAAFTAPRGNLMLVFDLAGGELVEVVEATDSCGVAASGSGFACSTGEGLFLTGGGPVRLRDLACDNHLVRIASA